MTDAQFHKDRQSCVGGSDTAAILGVAPPTWEGATPHGVWMDKTGRSDAKEETEPMHWGTRNEPTILDAFEDYIGAKIERNPAHLTTEDGILGCHLDGRFGNHVVEAKNKGRETAEWGAPGTDEVPVYVRTQVIHNMYVSGLRGTAYIPVLFSGNKFRVYQVEYPEALAEAQAAFCRDWWEKYVVTDTPPPAATTAEAPIVYAGRTEGPAKLIDTELEDACTELKNIKECQKVLDERKERATLLIQNAMGEEDAESLVGGDGRVFATWKESKTNRFSSKAYKAAHPKQYARFCKESVSRRFLLK